MNNEEIWKDITGYEGLYQVSDKGRVKSIGYGKERILKPGRDKDGYLFVILCKNHKMKCCRIHRLVSQSFILNPQNLPQINHKNEDKTDNKVDNLEWCSAKYNLNYGTHNQRMAETKSKHVLQYMKTGEFIKEWKSTMDVERNLGFVNASISRCCNGKCKSAYGFVWRYKQII